MHSRTQTTAELFFQSRVNNCVLGLFSFCFGIDLFGLPTQGCVIIAAPLRSNSKGNSREFFVRNRKLMLRLMAREEENCEVLNYIILYDNAIDPIS